jgi:hypothetical protein
MAMRGVCGTQETKRRQRERRQTQRRNRQTARGTRQIKGANEGGGWRSAAGSGVRPGRAAALGPPGAGHCAPPLCPALWRAWGGGDRQPLPPPTCNSGATVQSSDTGMLTAPSVAHSVAVGWRAASRSLPHSARCVSSSPPSARLCRWGRQKRLTCRHERRGESQATAQAAARGCTACLGGHSISRATQQWQTAAHGERWTAARCIVE